MGWWMNMRRIDVTVVGRMDTYRERSKEQKNKKNPLGGLNEEMKNLRKWSVIECYIPGSDGLMTMIYLHLPSPLSCFFEIRNNKFVGLAYVIIQSMAVHSVVMNKNYFLPKLETHHTELLSNGLELCHWLTNKGRSSWLMQTLFGLQHTFPLLVYRSVMQ